MLQTICCGMTMKKLAGLDFKNNQVLTDCCSRPEEVHIDPVGFVHVLSMDVIVLAVFVVLAFSYMNMYTNIFMETL